jgi:hypothetical protein
VDTVVLAAAVATPCVVALLGWLTPARGGGRSLQDKPPSEKWRRAIGASLVVGAVAAAMAAPIISVLWVVVALNLLLGPRENVPFSTYSMFSMPSATAWALRFENRQGELIPIATMGLAPHIMRKRFVSELRAARRRGVRDVDAARRDAASVLATLVEDRRPPGGPLATKPIAIVLVEYSLDSGTVRQAKTRIMETMP